MSTIVFGSFTSYGYRGRDVFTPYYEPRGYGQSKLTYAERESVVVG